MEQNKHTQGPWVAICGCDSDYGDAPQWAVAMWGGGDYLADLTGMDNQKANALLMAAAPDMLAALESAENALHNLTAHNVEADPIDLAALATVRAAIARAKGES